MSVFQGVSYPLRDWVDRDGGYFILNERIGDIADQVVKVRKQLRSITSTSVKCVDQSPCYPGLLFFDLDPVDRPTDRAVEEYTEWLVSIVDKDTLKAACR
ncbi:uncharacterized protein N7458_005608 [Penicillium daleae]|uniref:Uncharacterized protein n=1 Tax=Penicillium daleae TaxID=63821 RepID=A0AAD6C8C5_9EURO|nr:uncharacterized protein N7458_005608 [Penicillium daleae]KAJ5454652.1 hypothetical protein N7458_005608 [Penicillium daleae]